MSCVGQTEQVYTMCERRKKPNVQRVVRDAIKLADNHILYYSQDMRECQAKWNNTHDHILWGNLNTIINFLHHIYYNVPP